MKIKEILLWNLLFIAALIVVLAVNHKLAIAEDKITMPPISLEDKFTYYADKWEVKEQDLRTVVKCESNYNPNAVNWQDSHKDSKGSFGISQFAKGTITMYGNQIGIENPDPYNVDDSLDVMAYMFSKKLQRHWSCSRLLR